MKDARGQRARVVMKQIRDVLWNDWDPIGLCGSGPTDEYNGYIGGVYRLLAAGVSKEDLVNHLIAIEADLMGLSGAEKQKVEAVAEKLLGLDVSLGIG